MSTPSTPTGWNTPTLFPPAPIPAASTPTTTHTGSSTRLYDIAFLKNHFYREGRVTEEQALYVLEKATEILRAEPNVLDVDAPITSAYSPACLALAAHALGLQSVATSTANTCVSVAGADLM